MTSEKITRVFSEAICAAIPAPGLTISQWAENYRYLSRERSAVAAGGRVRWSNDLTPYLREIMDAVSDDETREVVFVKPNQIGGSECANNVIGFFMHIDPTTIQYACEDEKKAEAWSKESLAPMIRDTPALTTLVRGSRMRDSNNTIGAKSFPGGHLAIGWATSPATASSRPRRVVILDERDAYKPTSEGDYCELLVLRTDTYRDTKKIFKLSTPRDRIENPPGTPLDAPRYSAIEREYHESDRRRYFVPCPHCDSFQILKWSNVKWDDEPLLAYYVCEVCGVVIEEEDKPEMLERGQWRAEAEFRGRAGFHLNKLYSPFVTWGEMAETFLRAKRSGDLNQLRVWINTALAEGWQDPEEKIHTHELEDRREDYAGDGFVPAGVVLLTCGVDVQPNRLELEIVGWGSDFETWSIDYQILDGDPSQSHVWSQLREVLSHEFTRADGIPLKISCTAIDSGGHNTNDVYRFCHENRGRRVFAIKGSSTPGKPLVTRPTVIGRPPIKLFSIGTEAAKDSFIGSLRIEDQGPGYCHFPQLPIYDSEYFKQLLSERPVMRRGVRVWVKIRESLRNEALDCRVYAMAAYHVLNPDIRKLSRRLADNVKTGAGGRGPGDGERRDESADNENDDNPTPRARKPFVIRRSGTGFVRRW